MFSRKANLSTTSFVLILMLVATAAGLFLLVNNAYSGINNIEHKECRATIAIAEGINIEVNLKLVRGGIAPSQYCPTVIINEFPEKKAPRGVEEKQYVMRQIILKMDTAWWATWRNTIENTYKDFWGDDNICKKLYEFTIDDEILTTPISKDELALAIEDIEFDHLNGKSFGASVRANGGDIYLVPDYFEPKHTYQIFVLGPPEGDNAIIVSETGLDIDRKKMINDYLGNQTVKNVEKPKCGIIQE